MRVTRPEHARLRRLALDRGLTVSDLMRQAIASYTATDAARADLHLGFALERLSKDMGMIPTARFLEGLVGLLRQAAGDADGPTGRRMR